MAFGASLNSLRNNGKCLALRSRIDLIPYLWTIAKQYRFSICFPSHCSPIGAEELSVGEERSADDAHPAREVAVARARERAVEGQHDRPGRPQYEHHRRHGLPERRACRGPARAWGSRRAGARGKRPCNKGTSADQETPRRRNQDYEWPSAKGSTPRQRGCTHLYSNLYVMVHIPHLLSQSVRPD